MRESPVLDRAGSAIVRMIRPVVGRRFAVTGDVSPPPFFIVGSGRSGSTLVRRILNESPEIHIPPETFVLGQVIELYERNSHQAWAVLVRLVLSTFEYHRGFEDFGIGLRPLYQKLRDAPPDKRTLSHIIDALYRYHGETVGATFERWGDKTPLNTYFLDRIHRLFPDAQFVHVLRDGIDVAHSYVRSGLISDIGKSSTRWLTSVQAVQRFARRHPDRLFEIRYEALIRDTAETTQRLCTYLGTPFDESMLQVPNRELGDVEQHSHHARVLQPIRRDRIGAGRRGLSSEDLGRLSRKFLDQLEQAGYPPPEGDEGE
jgi:hypothetical protein